MEKLFTVVGGGAGSRYTAMPPPDYWNAIGLSGILQILLVLTGIIVVMVWILSITSKRRRG